VLNAKRSYDTASSKQGKKVLECLQKTSAQLLYYGEVFDTLAQHHPEYVALAWGAFGFVFMVSDPFGYRSCSESLTVRVYSITPSLWSNLPKPFRKWGKSCHEQN